MLKFKIPKAMVVLLALLIVSKLSATTVTYSTTGVFTSSGNSSLTLSGTTLAFTGHSDSITLNPPTSLVDSLGSFQLTPGTSTADFTNETFTLTISQTNPATGTKSPVATLDGSVSTNSLDNTGLDIVFVPGIFSIPGIAAPNATYKLNGGSGVYEIGGNSPNTVDVSARISARDASPTVAPVPPASLAGMGLFGVIGFSKLRKRLSAREA